MEVNAVAMGATHTQGSCSILILNDFNNMRFHFHILTFVVYKLTTTIDALHSTMTYGLKGQDLNKYYYWYTKNADILLKYYAPKEREFDFFASPSHLRTCWSLFKPATALLMFQRCARIVVGLARP